MADGKQKKGIITSSFLVLFATAQADLSLHSSACEGGGVCGEFVASRHLFNMHFPALGQFLHALTPYEAKY